MRLVASMIVGEVEVDRYIIPCIDHLLSFCEEVVMLFDGEDHSWASDLMAVWDDEPRVVGLRQSGVDFFGHEGRARQHLLRATLERHPTHILAIDADEFVVDGQLVRDACEDDRWDAWALCMQEVWNADESGIHVRQDRGWVEHDVAALWRVDRLRKYGQLGIADRALACGRTPTIVQQSRCGHTCTGILHFGWVKKSERQRRYDRYVVHDGGRFHASAHLQSIMMRDHEILLTSAEWPEHWEQEAISAVLACAS